MKIEHESGRYLTWVLCTGFALLVLLLLASGFVAVESMRFIESDAGRLVAEEQATIRLINEVQGEEGNLSRVFYELATGRGSADPASLLRRLDSLEDALHQTTREGMASTDPSRWDRVRGAGDDFIDESRAVIRSNKFPTSTLYRKHQILLDALADVASSSVVSKTDAQQEQSERASRRIRSSVILLAIGLTVAVVGAAFTGRAVMRMFQRLSWQAAELSRLSSRAMSDQEETARRLSHEMHDHFGQTLSAIEANLVAMKHMQNFDAVRMEDCLALLKEAVSNIREVSQLLRPSILDDFGLDASLQWLVNGFAERTGLAAHYTSSFHDRLSDQQETQLFRIAQEALTNITRHAQASKVDVELAAEGSRVRLAIADNGKGLDPNYTGVGLGLTGMRARARAANGLLRMESQPGGGVAITVEVPLEQPAYVT